MSLKFSPDNSRIAIVTAALEGVYPLSHVSLLNFENGLQTRLLEFEIPIAYDIDWDVSSNSLWMMGTSRDGEITLANRVNTPTNVITFRYPWFGTIFDDFRPEGYSFYGSAQLSDNYLMYFTAIDQNLSSGFVLYDLRQVIPSMNRLNGPHFADLHDVMEGTVIPYYSVTDLFDINRHAQIIALVERGSERQFRTLDIESGEVTFSTNADADIRELQFSPDGSIIAVRTASQRNNEVQIELWSTVSFDRVAILKVSHWQAHYCSE